MPPLTRMQENDSNAPIPPAACRRGSSGRRALLLLCVAVTAACALPRLPEPPAGPPEAIPGTAAASARSDWQALVDTGDTGRGGCMAEHIRDAIALNEARRSVYAGGSGGRSEPVSERLIRSERLSLAVAEAVDRRARPFQQPGIPIVCSEFISMARTPALPEAPLPAPPEPVRDDVDADAIRAALAAAYGARGFPGVAAAAELHLERLAATPQYHCMTRHLIESTWRVAVLAPLQDSLAAERGTGSTRALAEHLLRLHLAVFPSGAVLNRSRPRPH